MFACFTRVNLYPAHNRLAPLGVYCFRTAPRQGARIDAEQNQRKNGSPCRIGESSVNLPPRAWERLEVPSDESIVGVPVPGESGGLSGFFLKENPSWVKPDWVRPL